MCVYVCVCVCVCVMVCVMLCVCVCERENSVFRGRGGLLLLVFLFFFCNAMVIGYNFLCVHVLILYVCALIDLCVMALVVVVCVCVRECVGGRGSGDYVWTRIGMHVVYITIYIFLDVWWQ